MTHFLKLCYNVFILKNKIDARVFSRTCVNLCYILFGNCVNLCQFGEGFLLVHVPCVHQILESTRSSLLLVMCIGINALHFLCSLIAIIWHSWFFWLLERAPTIFLVKLLLFSTCTKHVWGLENIVFWYFELFHCAR
jgi:hypothetical protein